MIVAAELILGFWALLIVAFAVAWSVAERGWRRDQRRLRRQFAEFDAMEKAWALPAYERDRR